MSHTILIVEDEEKLAKLEQDYIEQSGFRTHVIHTGAGVVEWVKSNSPSLILLDIMLPEKDGMTICREIRQFSHVPIIMVTAKVEEIDRLLGLELGADDYVCKPFSPREVVARVKAQLRRVDMLTASTIPAPEEHEHFKLDENKLEVTLAGGTVSLTAIEMAILSAMYEREGCVFSRDKLIDGIYADHRVVSDRTIDSHIKKLRKKLQQADTDHTFIQSVYGVGYRFVMPD